MKKMNLPNVLTILRICAIPFVMLLVMLENDSMWLDIAAAVLFLAATLTDMLDGMLARKWNMVTNFGKFLDPLADKFLVFGTLLAMLSNPQYDYMRTYLVLSVAIILFRELAVTSIRLIASKSDGTVIAANMLGKIKTFSQSVCIIAILIDPYIFGNIALNDYRVFAALNYFLLTIVLFFTVWSGFNYIKTYFSYIDPTK